MTGVRGIEVVDEWDALDARLEEHGYRWELLALVDRAGALPALAGGLTARCVVTDEAAEDPACVAAAAWGARVRVRRELPHRLVVLDRELAAVSRPQGCLLITDPEVVGLLVATFEHHWSASRPLELPTGPDVRSAVARLLFDGLTDEAIARRLGVGVRTVARAVASLMAAHECQNRFQLGAALALSTGRRAA